MKRHYYAATSRLGVNAIFDAENPPVLYTFDTLCERNDYVEFRKMLERDHPMTMAITYDEYNRIKKHYPHDYSRIGPSYVL